MKPVKRKTPVTILPKEEPLQDWQQRALESLARAAESNAMADIIVSENNLRLAKLIKAWHNEPEPNWWKPGTRWQKGQPVRKCDEMQLVLQELNYLLEDFIAMLVNVEGLTQKQLAYKYGNPSVN